MDTQDKIAVFRDLISYNHNLHYWVYAPDGTLLAWFTQDYPYLDSILRHSECLKFAVEAPGWVPVVLCSEHNLLWMAVREFTQEGTLRHIHLLGPYFDVITDEAHVEDLARSVFGANVSKKSKLEVSQLILGLPRIAFGTMFHYCAMLQKCIDGREFDNADLVCQENALMAANREISSRTLKDRKLVYQAERRLLSQVRDGDFDGAAASHYARSVTTVRNYTDNPLLNFRIAYTIFTSLCVRAAIEGGLSPTVSYALGDQYIRELFDTTRQSELIAIRQRMFSDFVGRVQVCRTNPDYSKEIQGCIDYILAHRSDKLTIDLLAERLGYSKYYLSHRFKEEVGCTIMEYIKYARVERAKQLLTEPQVSIEEIASSLGFGSRAFFDRVFKSVTGMTPVEFRKKEMVF